MSQKHFMAFRKYGWKVALFISIFVCMGGIGRYYVSSMTVRHTKKEPFRVHTENSIRPEGAFSVDNADEKALRPEDAAPAPVVNNPDVNLAAEMMVAERHKKLEEEIAALPLPELITGLAEMDFSFEYVKAGSILGSGPLARILLELPGEPRIQRILSEGKKLKETDPESYEALLDTLRQCVNRFAVEFRDEEVMEPRAAVAWP